MSTRGCTVIAIWNIHFFFHCITVSELLLKTLPIYILISLLAEVVSSGPKFIYISYIVLTFESVDEIQLYYHSNKTSSAVLLHGTIYLL